MTFWVAGAAVVGAGVQAYSSNKATKAQIKSGKDANALNKEISDDQIALQREQFDKQYALQKPIYDDGATARNRLMQLLGLSAGGADNGSMMRDFGTADFQADPGYQFRQDQGQQALERSAAARGGLLSGAALKDTARFSQGLASQEYQSAFDRFQINRSNKLNPLQSLSGAGQSAAGVLGQAGQNYANSANAALGTYGARASENITGMGNARASGYLAQGNILADLINKGTSMYAMGKAK